MKKFYKETKFKKFNIHRSKKNEKRRAKQKRRKRLYQNFPVNNQSRKINRVTAPEIFSVVYNSEETINFFSLILNLIKKRKSVFINLKKVTSITPDAILYLLVLLQEAKNQNIIFSGNAPINRDASDVFIKSGFYDFVKSKLNKFHIPEDSDILKIKTGKEVNGNEAESIQEYLRNHLENVDNVKLKAIYSILIECMSNTNEYAGKKIGDKHWWTMALQNKSTGKILFAFVDDGVGIPTTVKRKWFDKSSDAELLKKAAMGIYQMSGSKEKTRNKGLPQIRKYCEDNFIQNLVIISNKGYYFVNKKIKDLEGFFTGTIIAWEFV